MTSETIKLFLIDDDPIFLLGLCTALKAFADLEVIAQANTQTLALKLLSESFPDLLILELNLGWQLFRQLRNTYPDLPILLLTLRSEPDQLIAAREYGARGYCAKGTAIAELVSALRLVASGKSYWQTITVAEGKAMGRKPRRQKRWVSRLRQSGLRQIEESIETVKSQLEIERLTMLDRLFWNGRYRELLAARWLVDRILPVEIIVVPEGELDSKQAIEDSALVKTSEVPALASPPQSVSSALFDRTLVKIQSSVENLTGSPIEIDILRADRKRELLYTVLNQVKKVRDELKFLQVNQQQLSERIEIVLRDLWQSSSINFFGKYYAQQTNASEYDLVNILLQNAASIQKEILGRIPWVLELFKYLLFEEPLVIDNVSYRSETPESIARAEVLIQNLIIQVANGVMQVILNNFSEVEIIKVSLYERQYISSRELARFRNNLSRKYRQEKYFEEPKNIFESQYRLFWLSGNQLKTVFLYAPRQEELDRLKGLPWLTTIVLETRDAIAPILRAIVAWGGSGLVYLLTQVMGRGIGLIVRGVIQGVGNAFQDNGYIKNNEQRKRNRYQVLRMKDEA